MKGRLRWVVVFFTLEAMALLLWLSDLDQIFSGITVYSVYCGKDADAEGGCINLRPITYNPSSESQEVVYRADSGSSAMLTDCNVHDRRNWECWYKDKGGRLTMVDGAFREEVLKDITGKDTFDSVRYVPKWRWWAIKVGALAE